MHHLYCACLCATLYFLVGCSKEKALPPPPPIKVEAATLKAQDVPNCLEAFGTLQPLNEVDIIAQVTGVLETTYVPYGQTVEAGTLLFQIDERPFVANLNKSLANLAAKEAAAVVAIDKVTRTRPLLLQKLISEQDFQTLQAQADQAKQEALGAKADVELAKINLGYTQIRAPFSGLSGLQMMSSGALIEANKTKLLHLNQMDPIEVNFSIPSTHFTELLNATKRSGEQLTLWIASGDDATLASTKGILSTLDNQIDAHTGTLKLQGLIPNKEAHFYPGQFVTVRLQLNLLKDACIGPQSSVGIGPKGPYVFVVKEDSTVELRLVKTGPIVDQNTQVFLEGVKPGERLVTLGQMRLRNGMPVQMMSLDGVALNTSPTKGS